MNDELHPIMDMEAVARRRPLGESKGLRRDRLASISSSGYSDASSVDEATSTALDLPPHLRDHLVSVAHRNLPPVASLEGERLPPIDHMRPPPMRIPLLPENMKMEPIPGINQRRQTKRVIVCGAGIIGLTTCYYLSKHGHEVLCVEKERGVGTQVSLCDGAFLDPALYASWSDVANLRKGTAPGRRNAMTRPLSSTATMAADGNSVTVTGGPAAAAASRLSTDGASVARPKKSLREKPIKIEMSALRDTKFWKWGLQFWHNSKKGRSNEHSRTIRELGFYSMLKLRELQVNTKKGDIVMDQTAQGTIEIFKHPSELEMTMESDRSAHLSELGMDLQPLHAVQARNLEPAMRSEVFDPGAILSAFGTSGDVHKMCQSLYRLCMRQGVMFRFNTDVQHILTDKASIIALQTRRGSLIEGDEFVLALGNSTALVAKRAGVKLDIYPVKGYVLSVPVASGFRAPIHNIFAGGQVLIAPLGKSLVRISGGVDFVSQKKTDQESPREEKKRHDWLLAQAKLVFPDGYLDVAKMQSHTCWRPGTADGVPLVGRTKIRNLYVNAGHGSKGWTLSFGAGAILADEISGFQPQLEISKFAPDRFGFFG
ncbi:d-amino acid dehydrogenase small subunit [Plasmopara halstedii]|uniref:D-amino acid dehydrogenase small subunit n=1 Tax=Plasmopara halstedii TaxID=4781 RepID=A0A0P1AM34_PLAHL|nr:d-amino acid dehydrogenase small subunit [Plasmopara halstedii]CEG41997.1 d-amino acid dehydrogenase small subunit [Plasmopara halstedii]|eukprot:XP_024578366.1 d-amino acid dehydrogenase small subunit [Plasmopara halstedii]